MLVEMRNVYLKRNEKTIIHDLNWEVEQGQHWAILGMNGAGKTTLLNLVCGYLYPTKGTIKVFEKPFGLYPLNELRKDIGWVSSSLLEKMKHHTETTTLEMVLSGKYASIGLYEQPSASDIDHALAILNQMNIKHLENQSFKNLSQGEKQRVFIGRALMAAPQLLILDEPCAGLDFLSKEKLLNRIEKMAAELKITIFYVSHHIDEILPIFKNTLLLREGRIFARGLTKEQLTSERLSDFCQTPVEVNHQNNRFTLNLTRVQ